MMPPIRLRESESSLSASRNCILSYPKCAQWRFRSDCANAQSDLNLSGCTLPKVRFMTFRLFFFFFFFFFFWPLTGSIATVEYNSSDEYKKKQINTFCILFYSASLCTQLCSELLTCRKGPDQAINMLSAVCKYKCKIPCSWFDPLYVMYPKYSGRWPWANSVDPDQPSGSLEPGLR